MEPPALKRKRRDIKCEQCQIADSKYSCPKCGFRSCSVDCVKKHKELKSCDGMPPMWKTVQTYSKFTPEVSIGDQNFFERVKSSMSNANKLIPSNDSITEEVKPIEEPTPKIESSSHTESLLQKSASFRRICLKIDAKNKIEKSRYDNFLDTIFWSIFVRFMTSRSKITMSDKTAESPNLSECCSYLVHDIPENIRVSTLVKQFVQPKINGLVISRSDLDLEKMSAFLGSPDSCLVYMSVNINGAVKYFPIDQTKSILDNLRNRTVNGHPEFIVCLNTDAFEFERLSQPDLKANKPSFYRQFNNNNYRKRPQNFNRGNGRTFEPNRNFYYENTRRY